ncbi:radical SAM protein [Streptomyces sp. SCA3-4]|uniref:radical SAM protein n=1 Tax=Streptomyces sichuanensis TaxID=2871810 RepID=UPI001CE35229|nr:radical SAM protein [Streptomyces sichuanensis]MCA6096667.1 radical SAM protein [Streptomyces sichuanensis]
MHAVIASPQEDKYLVARPGARAGLKIERAHYRELAAAVDAALPVPSWLVTNAHETWGLNLTSERTDQAVIVRPETALGYSRATWEICLGCNFQCAHCYLPERPFAGLPLGEKLRLLAMLRDAGVLWLQITGGEPLIDSDFPAAYEHAYCMGMLIEILTNGSQLHRHVDMLAQMPPHKVTVSLYGATPESFDALTRTKGSFKNTMRGLTAAQAAGVPVELTLIITKHNAHELADMRALAEQYAVTHSEYSNISPTYAGGAAPLGSQAPDFISKESVFTGCPAGHTFFHVDPHGHATMCKIGRENPINLMTDGLDGLLRLPKIADAQMLRTGGCSECALSATCRVCRPLARAYQEAKAPLHTYCQHGN